MIRKTLAVLAFAVTSLSAAPGVVWHEPAYAHPDLGGPTMRDPLYEAADNDLTIYQGFNKNGGANGNQTGGELVYRAVPRTGSPSVWTSVPLSFHADAGPNQYWKATLPSAALLVTDVIEYYIEVSFSGAEPETTYLFGGDLRDNFTAGTDESAAQAAPYSIRNRPGWIFHASNAIVAGDDIRLRLKTGYIGPANDVATLWSSNGAVYYTTDGSEPTGSLGIPSGTSSVAPLGFDGTERDNSGNGNAAFWEATLADVLAGLALGAEVKYKIGLWNAETNEEKFADHVAGVDNDTFVYQNGQVGQPVLTINGLNANYTTTKLFVDEIAGDSIPLEIVFEPGEANVVDAEIYTNLNRRDRADDDANGDGYDDGISAIDGNALAAGDDSHYYKAHEMTTTGPGAFALTLPASKTGAYRLTARWKVEGDPNWRWYTNEAANRRDHAVTVSPVDARDIILYEINVNNIEATGDDFASRSTIEDMHNAPGAPHNGNNRWDLDYLTGLGANWLWFQPIHPPARDGREPSGGWDTATPPYEPGSPYAVKNFFEVSPIMTKDFSGSPFNDADLLNQANRDAAMAAWANFVAAADLKDVGIMLDAPFNHTAFDVELAQAGIDLLQPDNASWSKTDEIRNRDARFFSAEGNYGNRASSAASIAAGPDRFDFGKWRDVKDVFFGRYDALVEIDQEPERSSYTNEGDWFDITDTDWTANDFVQGGVNKNVTRQVWKYFATYATHWLEKTRPAGENRNSDTEAGLTLEQRYAWDERGIDGLRCDFGQGLPPRAWEYMINVARERKWNFVMMSESLDGGAVTYRSNRHFDILNENIVFPLKSASTDDDYRNIFEGRRNAYGQGLVLINNVSHDEENYQDPWEALIRYSVGSSMDGVPMIFPGQELGISRTFGYQHYEVNFGKTIPHFKRFNSMDPIWNNADFGNDQLYPVYAGMGAARKSSPALRSSNRWFMDGDGGNGQIHAIAKYEEAGASPAFKDVVIALANLDRDNNQSDNFKINATLGGLLGLKDNRTYNTRNIAAFENPSIGMTGRRDVFLWGQGFTGAQLRNSGFFASLNRVPVSGTSDSDPGAWASAPFEAQYLKIYDVTPPPAPDKPVAAMHYAIGNSATFTWGTSAFTGDDAVSSYTVNGTETVSTSSVTLSGNPGDILTASVTATSVAGITGPSSPTSDGVKLLSSDGDEDADGQSNAAEQTAGTDPLSAASVFKITSLAKAGGEVSIVTTSVLGKTYRLWTSTSLKPDEWTQIGSAQTGTGAPLTFGHTPEANDPKRFYRVGVE